MRSTRVGRAGGQGRAAPRDYGSFACPGRCPVLPHRMGQGATLDAKTPKAEPTGCGRCSGTRTQKPLRVHPFEGCAFPYFAKHRDSPCLLVKGADCAGVCLAVLAWLCPGLSRFWKARLPAGMIRAHDGRLIKLFAPCYREGASGYLLVIATRASDSKWSGRMVRNFVPSLRGQKCHT